MLFHNKKRDYLGRRLDTESYFEYFDRSGREMCNVIRLTIESWLLKYPEQEKNKLIDNLRSNKESVFLSSFFELYLHNLMYCLGAEHVIVHPQVSFSSSRPDFLVMFPHKNEFYLEARIIHKSDSKTNEEKILGQLFEKINNALKGCKFLLRVQTRGKLGQSIPISKIASGLYSWTQSLDRQVVINAIESENENLVTKSFKYGEWEIDFTAIPLKEGKVVKEQAIGIKYTGGWVGDSFETLVDKVGKKSSKYGKLDKPLVLAINVTSHWGIEHYDIFQALLGQEAVFVNSVSNQTRWGRIPNGLWTKPNCQHTRMSAILVTGGLTPASMIERDLELIPHPFADTPLPDLPLHQLNHWEYIDERLVKVEGVAAHRLLGLPEAWID